jgi:hypothetical protein
VHTGEAKGASGRLKAAAIIEAAANLIAARCRPR